MKEVTGTIIFNSPDLTDTEISSDPEIELRDTNVVFLPAVSRANFGKAKDAWEALDAVGLDSGRLVSNGLVTGHNEQVVETAGLFPFRPQIGGLITISDSSETMLRSFTANESTVEAGTSIVSIGNGLQKQSGSINLYVIIPEPELKKVA